jgi:hypothetical protein
MKKLNISFGIMAMFFAALFLSTCNNESTADAEGETTEVNEGDANEGEASEATEATEEGESDAKPGPEITSMYICPMHCDGSGSSTEGVNVLPAKWIMFSTLLTIQRISVLCIAAGVGQMPQANALNATWTM